LLYNRQDVFAAMGKAALKAVEASMPTGIFFGTVISSSPLKINVEQKMTLEESHLVLTSLVSTFDLNISVDHFTEETSGGSGDSSFASHKHEVKGTKTVTVHLGLSPGEKVMLLRVQGGQKYIVLDRVR
jgi:hypothetical protein